MDLKEFLERVLPQNGSAYYAAITTQSGLRQTKLDDLSDLEKFIRTNVGKNVYYATGTFTGGRTQKEAELKKALFIDLDCGPESHKFPNKKKAITDLYDFCKAAFLPPSIVVDSGGGIHAYWCFDEAIPSAKWTPLARALKDLCETHSFNADPAVTADSARIMRPPETVNFKNNVPKPVRILRGDGRDYSLQELQNKLNVVANVAALTLAVDNNDLSGGVVKNKPYYAKNIVRECPMFAAALEKKGADVPEPLWTQQLHILAYCEDGADYIHEISKGYAGYAQTETQMKWNQRLAQKEKTGPTLCSTFSKMTAACQTCPYNGVISTPLQLGDNRDQLLPYPYNQDDRGVFIMVQNKDEAGVDINERLDITDFKVNNFQVIRSDIGTFIRFEARIAGEYRTVEVEYATITDRQATINKLSSYNVVLSRHEYNGFCDFMTAYTKKMQSLKKEQRMCSHLGWIDEPEGFALASAILRVDGTEERNIHLDRIMAGLYEPKGDKAPWIKVAHTLTEQNRHAINALILTSFASPLLEFVRDPAPIMAFVSTKSGTGKTTAMQIAQAVWGNPRRAMNQLDDTTASLFNKMGYLNNLPAYWDEVRVKEEARKFVKSIFQLTNGRERARLTQDVRQRDTGMWNTILTVASNESIADHALWASQDSEAGRARVFEIDVPVIEASQTDYVALNNMMLDVFNNYGVIGYEYAKFLVRNKEKINKIVSDAYDRYSADLLTDTNGRFWLVAVCVLSVAARLTNKLGYTKVDLKGFDAWLIAQFALQKDEVEGGAVGDYVVDKDGNRSNYGPIMNYLNRYRSNVVICDGMPNQDPSAKRIGMVHQDVKVGEIAAALGLKDRELRINKAMFNDYCYNSSIGTPRMLLDSIEYTEKLARLDIANKNNPVRVSCYVIKLPDEIIENMAS